MPKYSYIGTSLDGQAVKGVLSAENLSDLEIKLVNLGVLEAQTRPAHSKINQLIVKHFKGSEITRTTRQMAILLKSKVSLVESLSLVSEQLKDETIKTVIKDIIGQVESGKSMATAFAEYPLIFDELYVSMIEAGEMSGNLEFSFGKLADYREKSENLARKVKSAMAYPLLVIAVAIVVVIALVLYVVPVFSSMYENFGAELPALTRKVVSTGEFLRGTILYWIFGLLVFLLATMYLFTSFRFKSVLDKYLIKIPLIGRLLVKLITARFSRTLGSLLHAGVDIIYALEVSSRSMGNRHASNLLDKSSSALVGGKSLTSVLEETKLFPKTLLRMTASGEKTGQLGEMLTYAADFYEHETNTELTTLTTLIEPMVIIVLGAFIAFILVAMYLPLFELVGTI